MEYTKGEWNVQVAQPYDEHEFEVSYDTEDGQNTLTYPIADVHGKLEQGDAEANAQLIASAPDLYEALEETSEWLAKFVMKFYAQAENPTYEKMKALYQESDKYQRTLGSQALAKAEGK